MARTRMFLRTLAVLAGIPLVTAASCDPYGASFFRDDDGDYGGYADDYYYDPYYYDDCCYYDEVYYVEEVYYGP